MVLQTSYKSAMKREYEVILKTILINKSKEEEIEITKLLDNDLDWREIAGVLLSHRLCGYFYMGLTDEQRKFVPKEIKEAMKLIVLAQKMQQKNINDVVNEINKALECSEIHYAFLKGSFYGCNMYQPGIRRSNDIDLLAFEEDLEMLDNIMRGMGYIQSNMPEGRLVEATKKEKLIQRMNYHDLVPYVKEFEFGCVEIDINFLFDGKDNLIDQKVYKYGTEKYSGNGCSIVGLNCYTNMAFLCVHFYREATNTIWTEGKRDLILYKIADMINFVRTYTKELEIERLIGDFIELNIVDKAYFAFKTLKEFYENQFVEDVLKVLNTMVDDEKFMKEIYDHKNKVIIHRNESFFDASFNVNHIE